ncbi:MAG: type II toxin-antitoxin system PemK/MazF family toxin [Phycisphaerae bacterium]|nr:type II toxin-antitoxin system PemK/MazF family toxin [Tepidisphaeraceae bacterium]
MAAREPQRFDVFLVPLDPARGHEMQKTRPCVVVSPGQLNRYLRTVLVAPLTSVPRNYPFRVDSRFGGRPGQVALDQIRCVDRSRLAKFLGQLDPAVQTKVADTMVAIFARERPH